MMRTVWTWTRSVANAAAWALGIGCFGLLVAVGIGPRSGRYSTLTVLSGSMKPGIPVGAVVAVTPERPADLQVGQIITYAIPVGDHHIISHRVVKIIQGGDQPVFQTKGDANNGIDPWLAQVKGNTVWRVRAVVPGLGWMIRWLRQPMIHTVGVLVFPAMLAILWLMGIWRSNERAAPTDDDEKEDASGDQAGQSSGPVSPVVPAGRALAESGRQA
jgi:signal peptidase